MLNKNIFFNNFFFKSKKFYQNLKKTQKIFNSFQLDLKNFEIPLLKCYEKDYTFDFSPTTVKKFSKYKNIVVIGMGGSILGTKSIYSFLKTKVKKEVFFFDNLDENLHLQFNKINILKNSNDGFNISEEDMKLRGYGDILGFKQSGIKKFKLADPILHKDLFELAETEVRKIEINNSNLGDYYKLLKLYDRASIINDII